jgi:hypothetical protein
MWFKPFLLFTLILLSIHSCYSWWDYSWEFCRNIYIGPTQNDFNRANELIEFWVNYENIDECNSVRILNSSCENKGNEVKRYISYSNKTGCEVRFELDRKEGQNLTYSVYYQNPGTDDSFISRNYSIFGDNFENNLKRDWNIEVNETDHCGISGAVFENNKVFHAYRLDPYITQHCILNASLKIPIPATVYANISAKSFLGNRNQLSIYYMNYTPYKNDYFGLTNFIDFDTASGFNPRTQAKAAGNSFGPGSTTDCPGGACTTIRRHPINDDFFHETIFRYNSTNYTYKLIFEGNYKWSFTFNPDNLNWNNNKFYWSAVFWDPHQMHRANLDVFCMVTEDEECHVYNEPSIVNLGPINQFKKNIFEISTPTHNLVNTDIPVFITFINNNESIANLTGSNFQIFLDREELNISDFHSFANGSYSFNLRPSIMHLGSSELKIQIEKKDQIIENKTTIILLTTPKERYIVITNPYWKNYITAKSTNNPVLVYNSSRILIDKFIRDYEPDQIFQLGINLTFDRENYIVDSRETLIKILFDHKGLIIPSSKDIALKAAIMNLPILFDPGQETLEHLKPHTIYNLTSLTQVDDISRQLNPRPDHFILTNPRHQDSMFSFALSKNRNAFIIFSTQNPQDSKNKLIEEINKFNLPEKYYFDNKIFLTFIGSSHFFVTDPVKEDSILITDTPYCDVNGDKYQDFSCGRLMGSFESLSYQVEYAQLYKQDKTALILASYNSPWKYLDVITAGGTMPHVLDVELELFLKGFEVTRLVEKRLDLEQLNLSFVTDLKETLDEIQPIEQLSFTSFIFQFMADINKLILVTKAGDMIMYSLFEFDIRESWISILELKPEYPKHFPVFNEANLLEEYDKNQVLLYLSKGNSTHWFIPVNSTWYSTVYQIFDPSELVTGPLFHYLRYSDSFYARDIFLDKGALAMVTSSSDFYILYSGKTSEYFFKYFDEPIGKAMLEARNNNYRLKEMNLTKSNIYEKEYYDKILVGDPSLIFDPSLELKKTEDILVETDTYLVTFNLRPNYQLINHQGNNFIIFEDEEDYFIENNKPVLPLYKYSFTLPSNSKMVDLSVDSSRKTYDNITLPIIYPDPNHFTEEPFLGNFPDQFYWDTQIKLLDDRKILDVVFSPVIYYSNNTVEVFDTIDLTFGYSSPLEITEINVKNANRDDLVKINLEVFSNLKENREVESLVKIETKTFEDSERMQLEIKPGRNVIQLDYDNTTHVGNYSVSVVLVGEGVLVGPRYTHFQITEKSILQKIWYPISSLFKIDYFGFLKQSISFKENYKIEKRGDKIIMDYTSANITIHIEQDNMKTFTEIKHSKGILKIKQEAMILKYDLTTPEGSLFILKNKGEINQDIQGNEKILREILNKIIEDYRDKVEELGLTN